MSTTGARGTDVVVVGAGPYGLATAAHLSKAGIDFRIFGIPMGAWRHHMPKGMFLKSAMTATSISAPAPGMSLIDYCMASGVTGIDDHNPIPIDLFVNYGLQFKKRYVEGVEQVAINQIVDMGDGFQVSLANGETFLAKNVVVASGHIHFSYIPDALRIPASHGGTPLVSHTGEHPEFSSFAGRTVAIVGAGQSALESAALLREAGAEVHLVVRGPQLVWGKPPTGEHSGLLLRAFKPMTPLGPGWSHLVITRAPELISHLPPAARLRLVRLTYGPSGAWWLRSRFEGSINMLLSTEVEEAREASGRILLRLRHESGKSSSLAADHVLAATGYRVDVNAIDYLSQAIRTRLARVPGSAAPALSGSCQSSVPGLYFVGLSAAATFGPLLRFVHGTDFAARTVCRSLVSAATRRSDLRQAA